MKKKNRSLEDNLYITGLILLLAAMVALPLFLYLNEHIHIGGCIFNRITGYYCPGCGGTRAVFSLLQGNVLKSLYYHPVVLYGAVIYLAFMISHTIAILFKKTAIRGLQFHSWYLYGGLGIIVINFFARNILKLFFSIEL